MKLASATSARATALLRISGPAGHRRRRPDPTRPVPYERCNARTAGPAGAEPHSTPRLLLCRVPAHAAAGPCLPGVCLAFVPPPALSPQALRVRPVPATLPHLALLPRGSRTGLSVRRRLASTGGGGGGFSQTKI